MSSTLKRLAVAVALAGLVALPKDAAAQYFPGPGETLIGYAGTLMVTGPDVWIKYLGYEAAYGDSLSFSVDGGTTYTNILYNQTDPWGHIIRLNDLMGGGYTFTAGTEIIFSLYVADVSGWPSGDPDDAGKRYYTGYPGWNPDGLDHAQVATYTSVAGDPVAFNRQIGFEDILQDNDQPNPDWDYDDLVFATYGVEVVPEPMSVLLMATGLLGIGGIAYRRRRNAEADEA